MADEIRTTDLYIEEVHGPHAVTGSWKDKWRLWRVVRRQGYWRWHRQVSNDGVCWKETDDGI